MSTKYFKYFEITPYTFGSSGKPVMFDNLTQYVDIIDSVKDNVSFYNPHTIVSGDRPDTLSYKLYGTTDYYWTFFLMNDNLRESGWPVPHHELLVTAKKKYPHRTVVTNSIIAEDFPVGTTVTGNGSGTVGTIVSRNLDLGQLVIDTIDDNNFDQTESIFYTSEEGAFYTATLISESKQYDSVHHYVDSNGVYADIPIYNFGVTGGNTAVTYRDRLEMANEDLKSIFVLKPSVVSKVVSEFNNFHSKLNS